MCGSKVGAQCEAVSTTTPSTLKSASSGLASSAKLLGNIKKSETSAIKLALEKAQLELQPHLIRTSGSGDRCGVLRKNVERRGHCKGHAQRS